MGPPDSHSNSSAPHKPATGLRMPVGVTGYRTAPRAPERTYDFSRVFARFSNLVTLLCILTVGVLYMWTENIRSGRVEDHNTVAAERASLQSQLASLEAERTKTEEAMRAIGPQGLGIPPVAPSVILEALRERISGLRLIRVSYNPAANAAGNPAIDLEVTAPSNQVLATAVARLGEKPFLNPTVSSAVERSGIIAARITLETSGFVEEAGS